MKTTHHLILFAALAFAAGSTQALAGNSLRVSPGPVDECLSYDFLDLQYGFTSFDGLDNGHGVGANLSTLLLDTLYFTASGDWTATGIHGEDLDIYGASAGLGIYFPVAERLHLTFEGGGVFAGSSGLGWQDDDQWGFFAGPGLRYCLSPGTEVFANAHYVRFDDSDNLWEFNAGVISAITESVAFKLAGQLTSDDLSVLAGLRFYY